MRIGSCPQKSVFEKSDVAAWIVLYLRLRWECVDINLEGDLLERRFIRAGV